MMFDKPRIGQELLDVPMGDMIQQMAFAIAEAQRRLDENSIDTAQMMGGLETITDENTGEVTFSDSRVFFGKEKVTIVDAITLHNSTNDISLRQSIRKALDDADIPFSESNLVTFASGTTRSNLETGSPAPTSPTTATLNDPNVVYKVDGPEYYKYVSTGTTSSSTERVYTPVTEYSSNIASVGVPQGGTIYVPSRVSMLELGFSPTFYQFVDTIIEVKISIKYTQEGSVTRNTVSNSKSLSARGLFFGRKPTVTVTSANVNAAYSQKYSYSAEGSSLLRTKLVPIPPPAILEERIRLQMEVLKDAPAPTNS